MDHEVEFAFLCVQCVELSGKIDDSMVDYYFYTR